MDPDKIDEETMMRLIRDDRLESSKTRMEESISLLDQTFKSIKDSIQSKYDIIYKAKKEDIHQRILKMFADLMKNSGREIEFYISDAPSDKKSVFQYLQAATAKQIKKRNNTRIPTHTPEVTSAFETDFHEIYDDLVKSGIDMQNEVILADGSFLYQGHCYSVGDTIYISKLSNSSIQAKVELVTVEEVTLVFPDRSILKISKDDLTQHKIVLNNIK